jgi:hypothetical protein
MTYPESWNPVRKPRYNCPVCGVESMRSRTCAYHRRANDMYKEACLKRRVAHLVSTVNECIDKARA